MTCGVVRLETGSSSRSPTPSKTRNPSPTVIGTTCSRSSSTRAGGQVGVQRARTAGDRDVAVAGRLARPLERRLDPVGHEVERGPAGHRERLAGPGAEHEDRRPVRRLQAPPALPVQVPLAPVRPEHVPPHHVGAGTEDGRDLVPVVVTVLEHPSVQPLSHVRSEGVLPRLVATSGDEVETREGSVMSSAQLYDTIGATYTVTRRTEPRIAAQVWAALGDARTVLNVGAGTGSYEPPDRDVTAVEPSAVMRAQRPADAARCVAATAESLPFEDQSFDAAMALRHRSSLAGPDRRPARDAARRSPRGGVHVRHQ